MKSLYKNYSILFLFGMATIILLSRCTDTELPGEPVVTMNETIEPNEPYEHNEPTDQNNDGFLEWTMQDTLRTGGSLYGAENSQAIDLNSDDIDDIIITLFTADKYDLRTSSIEPMHSGLTVAITEYEDTLFRCLNYIDGYLYFSREYNTSELHICDTTNNTLEVVNISVRQKVESHTDVDTLIFEESTFASDSIEMYYTMDFFRSDFSEKFKRGDFLDLGERFIYFNLLHENELKKAYLKIRAESFGIIFLEHGVQK